MFRIANKKDGKDQMGESSYKDICGYSILGWVQDEIKNDDGKVYTSPGVKELALTDKLDDVVGENK
jgi:hypothetical protein